ncbi:MAG: glycosyltransferase, partial [Actinomycetota bacterium]|nr:glycosyltransferase [Actinomycetota bacterium]
MKVAIVAPSPVPYVIGGAQRLWDGLYEEINRRPQHDAELIRLPTREDSLPDLVNSYRMWSELDLSHFDRVISTKYPAWMVHHPEHVVYLLHTLRGLYDTYHVTGLPERVDHRSADLAALQQYLRSRGSRADLAGFFDLWEEIVT